jgi:hypothetical protein
VRERGGERWCWWAAWAESGEAGGVWMGRRREKRKGKKKRGRWAGPRVERWVEFVFFFSNPFQIFFKPFLNSNLLHLFKFKF